MAVVALIEIVAADPTATEPHFTPTHLWAISLRLGSSATLAFRRRYPMTAYATAWVLGLALTIGDYQVGVMIFVLWIGLYSIAAHATTRQLVVAVVGTCAGILIIAWSKPPDLTDAGAVWGSVFFAASAIAGYTVQTRPRQTSQRPRTTAALRRGPRSTHPPHPRQRTAPHRRRTRHRHHADDPRDRPTRRNRIAAHRHRHDRCPRGPASDLHDQPRRPRHPASSPQTPAHSGRTCSPTTRSLPPAN